MILFLSDLELESGLYSLQLGICGDSDSVNKDIGDSIGSDGGVFSETISSTTQPDEGVSCSSKG